MRTVSGGWHQPDKLGLYELDALHSPKDTAILQSRMIVGHADRVEFMARPPARRAARAPDAPKALLDPIGPPRYRGGVERLLGYGLGGIGLIIVASSLVGQVFAIADGRPETAVGLTAGVIGGAILYRVGFRSATH
jgi:hypothetical protein